MRIDDSRIKKNLLELDSWSEFVNFINKYKEEIDGCIYRGQRDPDWKLTPSFFRNIPDEYDWDKIQLLARLHLDNFKKFTRGRHAISYTDPNDCDETWWALGQHYGLATPLLDWVCSPYVAAFFGYIEECDEHSRSIFILDIARIEQLLMYNHKHKGDIALVRVDPLTHDNKRLVSQQGIFTYIERYKYRNVESYL